MVNNLSLKLQELENSVKEANAKCSSATRELAAIREEISHRQNGTVTRLNNLEQQVGGLLERVSYLTLLLDDSIPTSQPSPSPSSQSQPSQSHSPSSQPSSVQVSAPDPNHLPLIYTKDSETLIQVVDGARDAVESAGYQITGTVSRDQKTFLKLRFVGKV